MADILACSKILNAFKCLDTASLGFKIAQDELNGLKMTPMIKMIQFESQIESKIIKNNKLSRCCVI